MLPLFEVHGHTFPPGRVREVDHIPDRRVLPEMEVLVIGVVAFIDSTLVRTSLDRIAGNSGYQAQAQVEQVKDPFPSRIRRKA